MTLNQPKRFDEMSEPLDNFKDLAARTKVLERGLFSEPLGFKVHKEVSIDGIHELADVINQDVNLKYKIEPKLEYLNKEPDLLKTAIHLVEIYLTAILYRGDRAEKAKRYALSNLTIL